jgi:hypothetical protein
LQRLSINLEKLHPWEHRYEATGQRDPSSKQKTANEPWNRDSLVANNGYNEPQQHPEEKAAEDLRSRFVR